MAAKVLMVAGSNHANTKMDFSTFQLQHCETVVEKNAAFFLILAVL